MLLANWGLLQIMWGGGKGEFGKKLVFYCFSLRKQMRGVCVCVCDIAGYRLDSNLLWVPCYYRAIAELGSHSSETERVADDPPDQ